MRHAHIKDQELDKSLVLLLAVCLTGLVVLGLMMAGF